ncbi:conserved membrane protein of unknown function [Burkholderia multivorans]
MKRLAIAFFGFAWGLFITWAALYTFSRIHWPVTPSHMMGCSDMEHCAPHATYVTGLIATLLWPSIVFTALNAIAYRRWSSRKWGIAFVVVTLFVALLHLATYAIPALDLVG